ncbi:MAG: type I-U CRISPR-associated protein Csx17 [Acidimicrobiaceae bacterium]|nr:type I-U CRISPR-associated protein Csx17 [Acidimicrobiaceae bacterium]
MNTIHLHGCRAEPLLAYLSGLGVVRLIAEQADPDVSAHWVGDHLVLDSELDRRKLVEFFVEDYCPTPLVAPWNGRGGFQDGKNRPSEQIVKRVEFSDSARLAPYREAVKAARETWELARSHGLLKHGKVDSSKKSKAQFIELCRATFPDEALAWLDATVVVLDNDTAFPLLLGGTGGVFGSMDISFVLLGLLDVLGLLDETSNQPKCKHDTFQQSSRLIQNALFRDNNVPLVRGITGQFDPGALGGPNNSSRALVNPWSFVLAVEGSMVFASAAARRLSTEGQTGTKTVSVPFTVSATTVGYGSASTGGNSKGEIWAPMWRDVLSYREIRYLISEGRSQWGRGQARSGLDFVRATATLGVDRSIDEFVRYHVSVRNGQMVLAVPVGRFKVRNNTKPEVDILRQLDSWVERARSNRAPAAVTAALGVMDRAQFNVVKLGGSRYLQEVLAALADAEHAASRSNKYCQDRRLQPIERLSAKEWLPLLNDRSAEFRVAVGLASLRDRIPPGKLSNVEAVRGSLATLLRPVKLIQNQNRAQGRLEWSSRGPKVPNLGCRSLVDVLSDAFVARAVLATSKQSDNQSNNPAKNHDSVAGLPFTFDYGLRVDIADVGRLLCGQLDEKKLGVILAGLLLLDWKDVFKKGAPNTIVDDLAMFNDSDAADEVYRWHAASHPTYVVLAPFFAGFLPIAPTDTEPKPNASVPVRPRSEWIAAIRAGDVPTAARSAVRLLRGHGWNLIVDNFKLEKIEPGHLTTALLLRIGSPIGGLGTVRFLLDQQSIPVRGH